MNINILLTALLSLAATERGHGQSDQREFGAPLPRVPEENSEAQTGPGSFPNRVTAANVEIEVRPGSVLGGEGSNDLRVSFPSMGPIAWTDSRHNEGDIAFNIGPARPDDPGSYPPTRFGEWQPEDGPTTQAWAIDRRAGVALASVRANGFDNKDTTNGSTPVGTRYGATYFTHGFRSGVGYSPITGEYGSGNESQDLVMGMVGPEDEASFNLGLAYFPWLQGWKGAHVTTFPTLNGTAEFEAGSAGIGVDPRQILWLASGQALVKLPGVDATQDGMLFVSPADGSSHTKVAGAAPIDEATGWGVAIRQDSDGQLADQGSGAFSFLYIPWDTQDLLGAHIQGNNGSALKSAGEFTLQRRQAGEYALSIPGKSEADGILLLSNAGLISGTDLPTPSFLSYEFEGESAVIQSRDVESSDASLSDTDFYFVWVDFKTPLSPAGYRNPQSQVSAPNLSINANGEVSFEGILQSTESMDKDQVHWRDLPEATSPHAGEPGFYRARR